MEVLGTFIALPEVWTKFWIIPMTSSLKDFLDLMKTQFGDKTREEMEEMLKSGMSMEQVRGRSD